jgi:hypothetical protein
MEAMDGCHITQKSRTFQKDRSINIDLIATITDDFLFHFLFSTRLLPKRIGD